MGKHTLLNFKNRTVSRVFWISGIFSLRPVILFCRFISMNWYFLCASRVIHQLSSTLIDPVDRVTPELVDRDAVVTHEIIS